MKIKILILLFLVLITKTKAQNNHAPEPSVSSIKNYLDINRTNSTGVPNIDIPLFSLETSNPEITINTTLSYHVFNAVQGKPISDVGSGWTSFSTPIINKYMVSLPINETTELTQLTPTNTDLFYYEIPGNSGRFTISYDTISHNLKVNELSGNKIKIEFTRDLSSTKLIVDSFTITDQNGVKYIFDKFNISTYEFSKNYRSSYIITSIKDSNNLILVKYTYDTKEKNITLWNGQPYLKYRIHKINSISSSKGKIYFSFIENTNNSPNNIDDDFRLNTISLFDNFNNYISSYQFFYTGTGNNFLTQITKKNKNHIETEKTKFNYTPTSGMPIQKYDQIPNNLLFGIDANPPEIELNVKNYLSSIDLPTGGKIVYDYEPNQIYLDTSVMPTKKYFDYTKEIDFSTDLSRSYTFTIIGNQGIKYPVIIFDGFNLFSYGATVQGQPVEFSYKLYNQNNMVQTIDNSIVCCIGGINNIKSFSLFPGVYTIKINSLWGGLGKIKIAEKVELPKPYVNSISIKDGLRIKNIKFYNENNSIAKHINYSYQSFTNPTESSGYLYINDPVNEFIENGFVVYKNVREKEINGNKNNGYIDYYFNIPQDFNLTPNDYYFKNYNLTSNGILKQKKVYDSDNTLVHHTLFDYNLEDIPNSQQGFEGFYTYTPGFIQYMKTTSIEKRNNSDVINISEQTYDNNHFNLVKEKLKTHDGTSVETLYKYANELNNTKLINANIISTPLEITNKKNDEVFSITRNYFNNLANFFITSSSTTDLNGVEVTIATNDVYDDNGNVLQMTNKEGVSTSFIYGYNKTLPIAKIVGAKYNSLNIPEVQAAIEASILDGQNSSNEPALISALINLRKAPLINSLPITCYTYDPLIGVTNEISANGIITKYYYDDSGRLQMVKDAEGRLIKSYQYNLKH